MKSGVERKKDSCPGPEPNISKNPLTIWLVRHAEREDNINRHWHKNANPNGLKPDNPPLSARGLIQAEELAQR
jgi:broad specificity phosphatase PhoE